VKIIVGVCVAAGLAVGLPAGSALVNAAPSGPKAAGGVTVYTANQGGGTVSALDGKTLAPVQADIATNATQPQALALSKDGARLYCAHRGAGGLAVIDAATNVLVTTIATSESAVMTDVCVSPDGTRVYATDLLGFIEVFDTVNLVELPHIAVPMTGSNPPPRAIDISADGSAIFVLNMGDLRVHKVSTSTGGDIALAGVTTGARELRVSADGTVLIVVGDFEAQLFHASDLSPLVGGADDIGTQVDVAAAGSRYYVLNSGLTSLPPTGKGGSKATTQLGPSIDIYTIRSARETSYLLGAGDAVTGIAVTSDGARAYVTRVGAGNAGSVVSVDLADGTLGPTGATGSNPLRVVVKGTIETPVLSYFLPRLVALKLAGPGKDSLVAAGFYDDGGLSPDYSQEVTVGVGTFEEKFTLVANAKHTAYTFKGNRLSMSVTPNLKGSSRGRFKMKIAKTTLAGAVDPDVAVGFHFRAVNLPDAQGRVTLTAGKYKLGGKRGALISPQFFPAKATATAAGPGLDAVSFTGGFATNGVTPVALSTVRFSFGTFEMTLTTTDFVKAGDKFTAKSLPGVTPKFSVALDFLRETVVVKLSKAELGPLAGPTADFVFNAGSGAGTFRNTVKLGSKLTKRFY